MAYVAIQYVTGATPQIAGRICVFRARVYKFEDEPPATRFSWSVTGGRINRTTTEDADPNIEWTLPSTPGSYTISVVSFPTGLQRQLIQEVLSVPTAVLTASTLNPLYGASVSLSPVFSHGYGEIHTVLGPGSIGAIVSGGTYTIAVGVVSEYRYYLTVSYNEEVANTSPVVSIIPQTPVVTLSTPAKSTLTVSRSNATLEATLTGMSDPTLVWTCASSAVTLDVSISGEQCLVTPLAAAGGVTVRVASLAYPQFYKEFTFTVYDNPVALLTVSPNPVLKGADTTLTVVAVQNGTATLTDGLGPPVPGNTFRSTPITAAKDYTLTVTNPEGYVSTSSVIVRPYDVLAGSARATPVASTPNLTVRTQFKATGLARPDGWGALGSGIWLRGSNHSVSPNSGQGHLSTQIQLAGAASDSNSFTANMATRISLLAQAFSSVSGTGSLSVLKPLRYRLHVPRVYLDTDPDGLMQELLNTLDQIFGDTLGGMAFYPQNLVYASMTKFAQELLEHYGNPFKFQTCETMAKLLVNDLPHLYTQRGTLLGVKRAILYLLKRDIEILDFATVAWRLGISELELTTILGGIQGTMVYWVDVPRDYTSHQVRNLKAIVEFMAPLSVQVRYVSFS